MDAGPCQYKVIPKAVEAPQGRSGHQAQCWRLCSEFSVQSTGNLLFRVCEGLANTLSSGK